MGEYLISWNNKIWEWFLNQYVIRKVAKLLPVSEVLLSILIISAIVTIALTFLRYQFRRKGIKRIFPYFGGIEILYLLSVSSMIKQLPNLHHRLQNALQSLIQVVQTYPKYTVIFQQEFDVDTEKAGDIARTIYQLPIKQRILENDFLFSHIYQTLDEVKGNVDLKPWVGCTLLLCLLGVLAVVLLKKRRWFCLVHFATLIFCSLQSVGMLVAGCTVWVIGLSFSNLFAISGKDMNDI